MALPDIQFFNWRDRSSRHKTRALFVTLEFNAYVCRLDQLWEGVGECRVCGRRGALGEFQSVKHVEDDRTWYTRECCGKSVRLVGGASYAYNRFITAFRKRYGDCSVIRVYEAHKSGYPHIHLIMITDNEFEAFYHDNHWRVQGKHDIEGLWPWGFSDVEALASTRGGINYVVKYLGKLHEVGICGGWDDLASDCGRASDLSNLVSSASVRTLSLMWVFRKRAFSVSRSILDEIRAMHNSNSGGLREVDLAGDPVWEWSLIGFWGGDLGRWSVELSPNQFAELKRSSTWSEPSRG